VRHILIAGCGWLGTALGLALARRGDAVWGLRRHPSGLPPPLQPIAADLADPATLTALPSTLDAVVFAAAPEASDGPSYERTYVRGLANVLEALHANALTNRLPRVVLLSSTSVYGQSGGEWVDESSSAAPNDFRGRFVVRGESTLSESGFPAIALRLGGLYGPGRESLVDAVRSGRATLSPEPNRFTNRIHLDDAVGAIVHLIDLPAEAAARLYVGVDHEPAARNDVLRWLASRLGVALTGAPVAAERERDSRGDTNKRCSSVRLRHSGYRFRYPTYREGYEAILDARARARA
jgi:nucleoside-diphosphate-sugar epimerase